MTPKEQLDGFLGAFAPEVERAARSALTKLRRLVPGAVEMVYDNAYALVVGFGPTERPSEAVLSVAIFPKHVTLCFLYGAELEDPEQRLKGSGNQVRNVRLETAGTIDEPAVRRLIKAAVASAEPAFERGARRKLVVRAISKNRQARRR